MTNQSVFWRTLSRVATYAVFVFVFLLVAYPLFWMFSTSLREQWQIFDQPFALPESLNFSNYVRAWTQGNFSRYFLNSVLVTLPSVVGVVFVSALAGYAFARLEFRGKRALLLFFLVGIMVPPQAVVIPAFLIVSELGLLNTYWSLIFTSSPI